MLENLNAASQQPAYAGYFVIGGLFLGIALAFIHPILFLMTFALGLYISSIVKQIDKDRKTYTLEYKLDKPTLDHWNIINQALHTLAKSQSIWRITTLDPTYDWKRNAGANSLLNRVKVTLAQTPALYIASNFTPHCLHIGDQYLFFFPDRIYVHQNGIYGAIEYDSLNISTGETQFIESETPPRDAQIVGSTWQYINKSGGPDRRFSVNPQLPIALYGAIELRSQQGLYILLHISDLNIAKQFHQTYEQSRIRMNHSTPQQKASPRQTQQHQANPSSTPPLLPHCYQVLGLEQNCSKEEAIAKYRQLASSYHPDRVNNLAPEFKALAHQKMTEFNNAVTELKKLRGW